MILLYLNTILKSMIVIRFD